MSTQSNKIIRKDGSHLVSCPIEEYDRQFDEKKERLRTLINWKGAIDSFESEKTHFRMRANFQLWHDDSKFKHPDSVYYAMFEISENDKGKKIRIPYEVKSFPRGSLLINNLMDKVKLIISREKEIFEKLFEVRFLTTLSDQAQITFCYHKNLTEEWRKSAIKVSNEVNAKIIGRSRKVKIVACPDNNELDNDEFIIEELDIFGEKIKYYQTEGAFSQPNAKMCQKMIEWAINVSKESSKQGDLLELYCGGGTFTAAMAKYFPKILATEISKSSVNLALKAFALNNIQNIKIARLSSEEFTQACEGKSEFQRLKEAKINIADFDIKTVLVDPPRAGMDLGTCNLISRYENIIYISCNPETLARDLEILSSTHKIIKVAAFDQFPYTHHLETGVFLSKTDTFDMNDDNQTKNDIIPRKKAKIV